MQSTQNKRSYLNATVGITAVIICLGFTYLGQSFTAYNDLNDSDSSYFVYGGMIINKGLSLYADFFDQKPPAIFYQNAILLKFFGHNFKAFALAQGLAVLLLHAVLYASLVRIMPKLWVMLLCVLFCYAFNLNNYGDFGNRPEFSVAFFECLAFCAGLQFLRAKGSLYLILMGALSASAFFYKPIGMASFLAMFALLMSQMIVKPSGSKSSLRKILFDVGSLCLGFLSVVLLVSLYFASKGLANDLWQATIFLPLSLSGTSKRTYLEAVVAMYYAYGPLWGALWPMLLLPFLLFKTAMNAIEKQLILLIFLFTAATLCGVVLQKMGHPHYYHTGVGPLVLLSVFSLFLFLKYIVSAEKVKALVVVVFILSSLYTGRWPMMRQIRYYKNIKSAREDLSYYQDLADWLKRDLKKGEKIYYWSHGYIPYILSDLVSPGLYTPQYLKMGDRGAEILSEDLQRFKDFPQNTESIKYIIEHKYCLAEFFCEGKYENQKSRDVFAVYQSWRDANYGKIELPELPEFNIYKSLPPVQ
ncbi:MAG: hypothetical protein HQL32_02045 [Planctomycetes bacterium]|nr:hypothetical protein [Planctomycetota bacterium]